MVNSRLSILVLLVCICSLQSSPAESTAVTSSSTSECSSRTHRDSAYLFPKGSTGELFRGTDLDEFVRDTKTIIQSVPFYAKVSSNRDQANLGNEQGELLSSYLNLYRASRDVYYLDRFVAEARRTVYYRDDQTGAYSAVGVDSSGRPIQAIVPAWSTRAYSSDGAYFAYLVEAGQLSYPMADFAQMVINGPACLKAVVVGGNTMLDHAHYFRDEVKKTVVFFNRQFQLTGTSLDRGFWVAPFPAQGNQVGKAYPVNYQLSMARVLIMMYLATKELWYLQRAGNVANFFFDELEFHSSLQDSARPGYYLWRYWPKIPSNRSYSHFPSSNYEDIVHMSIAYDFVALANRVSISFFSSRYKEVLTRLGFTYIERYSSGPFYRNCMPGIQLCGGHTWDQYMGYIRSDGPFIQFAEFALPGSSLPSLVRQYTYDGLVRNLNLHTTFSSTFARKSMSQLIWYWSQRFRPLTADDLIR